MTSVEVKKVLATLLRDPGNQFCADCKKSSHPRWSSWSLGIFICIKCAGYHRSLGTHISRVKSVDLDTWKEENLIKLVEFGNNSKANEFYENKLGGEYVPDQSRVGTFIKTKYELKKWCGVMPVCKRESSAPPVIQDNTLPVTTSTSFPSQTTRSSSQLELNLSIPKVSPTNISDGIPNDPYRHSRSDLKKSILSLYSKPSTGIHSLSNMSNLCTNSSSDISINKKCDSTLSLDDNDLFKNVWS